MTITIKDGNGLDADVNVLYLSDSGRLAVHYSLKIDRTQNELEVNITHVPTGRTVTPCYVVGGLYSPFSVVNVTDLCRALDALDWDFADPAALPKETKDEARRLLAQFDIQAERGPSYWEFLPMRAKVSP